MMIVKRLLLSLVLIPVVALAAGHQDSHAHDQTLTPDPNWTDLMASMDKMHAAMNSVEGSGNRDVDFVKLMLPHHQGAVEMAKAELTYGRDPQMRRLAQEIITDQVSEIQLMKLWLKQHDVPASNPNQVQR
jgi:uncharacterized protein (DUF305 family)